jgi:hypothetical protein
MYKIERIYYHPVSSPFQMPATINLEADMTRIRQRITDLGLNQSLCALYERRLTSLVHSNNFIVYDICLEEIHLLIDKYEKDDTY